MKRIVVFTPFKTGSTSICVSLRKHGHDVTKIHAEHELAALDLSYYDVLVTSFRSHREVYASAFFHDIDSPLVPYYYGNRHQVLDSSVEQLLSHYKKFDWKSFPWLNFPHHAQAIQKRTGIDPTLRNGQRLSVTFRESFCVLCFRIDYLDVSFMTGCAMAGLGHVALVGHENLANDKWYSEKYKEFLQLLEKI